MAHDIKCSYSVYQTGDQYVEGEGHHDRLTSEAARNLALGGYHHLHQYDIQVADSDHNPAIFTAYPSIIRRICPAHPIPIVDFVTLLSRSASKPEHRMLIEGGQICRESSCPKYRDCESRFNPGPRLIEFVRLLD